MALNNINTEDNKPIMKLNPESDRYRICPECKVPFMTDHRSRDFHNRKCANDYNNRKKRLAKKAEKMLNYKTSEEATEEQNALTEVIINQSIESKKDEIVNSVKATIEKTFVIRNEYILSTILRGQKQTEVSSSYMTGIGFDLNAYDSREKLPHCDLYKLTFGNYSIVWSQPNKILITHQKHLLWTSIQ